MEKTGFIKNEIMLDLDEFHFGIIEDLSVIEKNQYATGKVLGIRSTLGEAEAELIKLGCSFCRIIPLYAYDVKTYRLF